MNMNTNRYIVQKKTYIVQIKQIEQRSYINKNFYFIICNILNYAEYNENMKNLIQ